MLNEDNSIFINKNIDMISVSDLDQIIKFERVFFVASTPIFKEKWNDRPPLFYCLGLQDFSSKQFCHYVSLENMINFQTRKDYIAVS